MITNYWDALLELCNDKLAMGCRCRESQRLLCVLLCSWDHCV